MALVVDYKNEDWKDSEQEEYLRPTTLFIPKNFPGYLKRAGNWDKAGRPAKKTVSGRRANSSTSASFSPCTRSILPNVILPGVGTTALKLITSREQNRGKGSRKSAIAMG
jgi:hypothetical protein